MPGRLYDVAPGHLQQGDKVMAFEVFSRLFKRDEGIKASISEYSFVLPFLETLAEKSNY